MPLLNTIATPYADALLQVGESRQESDRLAQEAQELLQVWHSSDGLRDAMRSPVLSVDSKKKALAALFQEDISPAMANLLKLLADRQRIGVLDAVLERFLELYRQLRGIALAEVVSASPLSDEQLSRLTDKVKAVAGSSRVELRQAVDPSLIGGFVVRIGSQVIDYSLLGQVRRLGLSLARAS